MNSLKLKISNFKSDIYLDFCYCINWILLKIVLFCVSKCKYCTYSSKKYVDYIIEDVLVLKEITKNCIRGYRK